MGRKWHLKLRRGNSLKENIPINTENSKNLNERKIKDEKKIGRAEEWGTETIDSLKKMSLSILEREKHSLVVV